MPVNDHNQNWSQYQMLVLNQLTDLKAEMSAVRKELEALKISNAVLKVQAGAIGAVAAMICSSLIQLFINHH